jgi:glutamate racemase
LLIERLQKLSPWPVNFLDPAPAIARRVVNLLGAEPPAAGRGTTRAVFTSGLAHENALRRFGIGSSEPAASAAR